MSLKILIVRLGALGDIVHALPVAAALRERYPDAQIDWLVDAKHAAVLDLVPVISRRVAVDSRRWGASFGAVRALRRERYDAAVDLQGLVKSAAFARMSGAARVIGFARAHLRERTAAVVLLGDVRSGERDARHRQEPVGAGRCSASPTGGGSSRSPSPESAACEPVVERVRRAGLRGYALINPGAAWPNKRWPPGAIRRGCVGAGHETRAAAGRVVGAG